ncbi:hypothetical protein OG279_26195 [Streptomyces sp. NBC_01201]|uniref:hypothetical protein n=1 Tax=unclassified Streptomyces TaxID=2593676 RepID=UPI002E0FBD7F|nr:hypothetical protein OG725_24445 [Streptomyces sp. NBC_01213]WSQ82778.1 hypothetical protein OG725_37390 [Streptomyces sp. NBC_01213]WSR50911.1 hypothetical protein OG279_26195 [Streptomyces sp. NBC_01201]
MNVTLSADVVMAAGPMLGGVGTSGLALANGIVLLAGLRGSDRVNLDRDKAGALGIGLGILSSTADTVLSQLSEGAAQVPTSLVQGGAFGNVGMGGTALALTATIFLFRWKKLIIPAFLGTGAGVIYSQAGGIWGIGQNLILMTAGAVGAL